MSNIVVGNNITIQHHLEETCALIPRSLTFGYFRLSLSSSCSQLSTVPQSIADSPREGPSGVAVLPESSSSLRPRGGVSGRAGERPRESSGWMEAAAAELLSAENEEEEDEFKPNFCPLCLALSGSRLLPPPQHIGSRRAVGAVFQLLYLPSSFR